MSKERPLLGRHDDTELVSKVCFFVVVKHQGNICINSMGGGKVGYGIINIIITNKPVFNEVVRDCSRQ